MICCLALEMGVTPSSLLDEDPAMLSTLIEAHNFRAKEAERRGKG